MIDRIAPSNRPKGPNDGTQSWRSLLFSHWEIPVSSLRSRLPDGLEIDTYDGRAFIAVVPFKMRNIRPRWLPHSFAIDFLEINVRTYVLYNGKPGVYFFSLDANSRLAVWAARTSWSLPYRYSQLCATQAAPLNVYDCERPRGNVRHRVSFRVDKQIGTCLPGTLEHFLLERYLMFLEHKGRIYSGQVHHSPYPVFTAAIDFLQDDLIGASGLPAINRPPDITYYSPGVDVEVFGMRVQL